MEFSDIWKIKKQALEINLPDDVNEDSVPEEYPRLLTPEELATEKEERAQRKTCPTCGGDMPVEFPG